MLIVNSDLLSIVQQFLCHLQHMSFAYFAAGDVIFRQGDTGEHFYIILSGIVDVLVNDGGPDSVRLPEHMFCTQTSRSKACQSLHSLI